MNDEDMEKIRKNTEKMREDTTHEIRMGVDSMALKTTMVIAPLLKICKEMKNRSENTGNKYIVATLVSIIETLSENTDEVLNIIEMMREEAIRTDNILSGRKKDD